jgi:hypothetical protein
LAVVSSPEIGSGTISLKRSQDTGKWKGLTFLFQGDSIADGNRTRDDGWNHVLGHGYAYLIGSRLWYDHTDQDLMFYNRGISGNRVRDLDARLWISEMRSRLSFTKD